MSRAHEISILPPQLKKKRLNILLPILTGLLVSYLCLVFTALFLSDKMLFPAPPPGYGDNDEILKLPLPDGSKVAALHLPNPKARFTLLHSHGNGEDFGYIRLLLEAYRRFGYAVFAYDYPGYGRSEGVPGEAGCYAAIDAAYLYLTGTLKVPPESIIAYGRSVGAGPTLDLASRKALGGVILESAFVSAFRVVSHWPLLPWDKFPNLRNITRLSVPLLIIHGSEDRIVNFWHGPALYEAANQPKTALWVEGAGHNNLIDFAGEQYWNALKNFNRSLPAR